MFFCEDNALRIDERHVGLFASRRGAADTHDESTFGVVVQDPWSHPLAQNRLEILGVIAVFGRARSVELESRGKDHGGLTTERGLRPKRQNRCQRDQRRSKNGSIFRDAGRLVTCTRMSETPSDKPPKEPAQDIVATLNQPSDRVKPEFFPFGLSDAQFAKVMREMLAVARLLGGHGVSPRDVVQEAFVKAVSKLSTERPSIQDEEKVVGWLCELTKWEALTMRNAHRRRARREVEVSEDIAEMLVAPPSVDAVEARKMLDRALQALEPADRELLRELYTEGKTIAEIAAEKRLSWSVVDSRRRRALDLLYAAIQASMAALVLLLPKKARAFVAHIKQQTSQVVVQTTQFGGAMTVTAICGVLVPTSSSLLNESSPPLGLTTYSTPQATLAQPAPLQPDFVPEVEPEEPKALDTETNPCSGAGMKFTKTASVLLETAVPLAFLVAPALTQVACTGTEQQTPPARQPEEEPDDMPDPYDIVCENARRFGEECPSREAWEKIGRPR